MKTVLMIAYHYPPWSGGSGVHRTLKFTKYLPEYGWRPIVLTAGKRAYGDIGATPAEIPDDIEVTRAFALDTARHFAFRGSYLHWMALPDRWISWWPAAVLAGRRLIRKHRPDVIWSTFPIATAQLIGLTLHRLSGIPWVADFRDPMTEVDPQTGEEFPPDPEIRRFNGWIERPALERASRVVVTTPGTLAMYGRRFPKIPAARYALIPNGYDEEDFAAVESSVPARTGDAKVTVLLHSGVLYPSARDPTAFFAALSELRKAGKLSPANVRIVLRACGSEDLYRPQLRVLGIDDIVFLEPTISHHDSLIEMMTADGLLIFQAANCNWQIPAKVYECLRARRPILALTDPKGDTAGVLRGEGIDTIVPLDSKADIAAGLMTFLEGVRGGKYRPASPVRHSRKARTRELADLLDSVCESRTAHKAITENTTDGAMHGRIAGD